jgi:hypothetical protein
VERFHTTGRECLVVRQRSRRRKQFSWTRTLEPRTLRPSQRNTDSPNSVSVTAGAEGARRRHMGIGADPSMQKGAEEFCLLSQSSSGRHLLSAITCRDTYWLRKASTLVS